jgi:hypothetical protein
MLSGLLFFLTRNRGAIAPFLQVYYLRRARAGHRMLFTNTRQFSLHQRTLNLKIICLQGWHDHMDCDFLHVLLEYRSYLKKTLFKVMTSVHPNFWGWVFSKKLPGKIPAGRSKPEESKRTPSPHAGRKGRCGEWSKGRMCSPTFSPTSREWEVQTVNTSSSSTLPHHEENNPGKIWGCGIKSLEMAFLCSSGYQVSVDRFFFSWPRAQNLSFGRT